MSFFNKLIPTGNSLFAKSFPDFSYGLIKKLGLENALRTGRWADLEKVVVALGSEDLTRLLDGLCLTDKYEAMLKKYFLSGKSEVRELIAGAHHVYLAWKRRGTGKGASLTEEQVDGFMHHLEEANRSFSQNFSTPVLEAESFARLVRVYMGFSETEAAQSAYLNASNLIPEHLLAHLNYFKVTSPKWLGDLEIMRSFVIQIENPQLRDLLKLVYLIEVYSDLFFDSESTSKSIFQEQHKGLIAEVLAAVLVPDDDSLVAIYTCNYLACLYRILGYNKQESALRERLESRRTNYPWAYFGWN